MRKTPAGTGMSCECSRLLIVFIISTLDSFFLPSFLSFALLLLFQTCSYSEVIVLEEEMEKYSQIFPLSEARAKRS